MSNANNVPKVYRNVIEEVIKNVKEAFLNEGVDEQVLQELKQIWENKLLQSRAVDGMPADQPVSRPQYMYPHIVQSNQGLSQLARQPQQQQQVPQRVAISHATSSTTIPHRQQPSTTIPGGITHRQAPTGQTAIIFPDAASAAHIAQQPQTHIHALSQMTPAATAATLALPGMQQVQQPSGAGLQTSYPTARTIQVTQAHHQQLQQQQQHQQQQQQQQVGTSQVQSNKPPHMIIQVDGANDSDSDGDDDDDLGDDDDGHDKNNSHEFEEEQEPPIEEEEPLNSEDDDSDDGATDLFDTENVVVCQFEKIARSRNKWKFHLKDGIMNVKGKDYIFHKATGEAEW